VPRLEIFRAPHIVYWFLCVEYGVEIHILNAKRYLRYLGKEADGRGLKPIKQTDLGPKVKWPLVKELTGFVVEFAACAQDVWPLRRGRENVPVDLFAKLQRKTEERRDSIMCGHLSGVNIKLGLRYVA
jgi:hypothetical protein